MCARYERIGEKDPGNVSNIGIWKFTCVVTNFRMETEEALETIPGGFVGYLKASNRPDCMRNQGHWILSFHQHQVD